MRDGPFDVLFGDFEDLHLANEKRERRGARLRELQDDEDLWDDPRAVLHDEQSYWDSLYRFNPIVFSYFLTGPALTEISAMKSATRCANCDQEEHWSSLGHRGPSTMQHTVSSSRLLERAALSA